MAIASRGIVDQTKLRKGIQRVERALAPDVVRIMYNFAANWMGDQSLFFKILLSDEASLPSGLLETTKRIKDRIFRETKADELGLEVYFNFRSESEQASLREPSWEKTL